jgi:phosphatidylglycerophosphatase A
MLAQGLSWPAYAALCCTVSAVGIWAAGAAEQTLGQHDDSRIVIDEVAGTLCALASVDRANLLHVALATALFRVLDIVKPWPLRELDRRVTGGLGVMLDDVVAGIAVALVFAFLA